MNVIHYAAENGASGTSVLVVIVLVFFGLLVVSVILHPYTSCSSCKGAPKKFGSFATNSFRLCPVCNGSGREPRILARMLGIKR